MQKKLDIAFEMRYACRCVVNRIEPFHCGRNPEEVAEYQPKQETYRTQKQNIMKNTIIALLLLGSGIMGNHSV